MTSNLRAAEFAAQAIRATVDNEIANIEHALAQGYAFEDYGQSAQDRLAAFRTVNVRILDADTVAVTMAYGQHGTWWGHYCSTFIDMSNVYGEIAQRDIAGSRGWKSTCAALVKLDRV